MESPEDPFAGLADWGREAERRIRREHSRRGLSRWVGALRRRRGLGLLAGIVAVTAVVSVGYLTLVRRDPSAPPVAYATQSPPAGVFATTTASARPTDPFAGTPAVNYPLGEAGIAQPVAAAAPGFTVAEVRADLATVRAALIAARLDHRMLIDHDPGAFLALLAPNARTDVAAWFADGTFGTVATWIGPQAPLDPDQAPRVSGRTTFRPGIHDGLRVLQVITNYVWVYAFAGPEHPLAIVHDEVQWEFTETKNLRKSDIGMFIVNVAAYQAWIDCTAAKQGILAPTRPGEGSRTRPSEDPNAYLMPDHSLDIGDGCGLSTAAPVAGSASGTTGPTSAAPQVSAPDGH